MKKFLKNYLKGVGSVIDIAPATDFMRFIPQKTGAERLHEAFSRTFKNIEEATVALYEANGIKLICRKDIQHNEADLIPTALSQDEKQVFYVINKLAEDAEPSEVFTNPMPLHIANKEKKRRDEAAKIH